MNADDLGPCGENQSLNETEMVLKPSLSVVFFFSAWRTSPMTSVSNFHLVDASYGKYGSFELLQEKSVGKNWEVPKLHFFDHLPRPVASGSNCILSDGRCDGR